MATPATPLAVTPATAEARLHTEDQSETGAGVISAPGLEQGRWSHESRRQRHCWRWREGKAAWRQPGVAAPGSSSTHATMGMLLISELIW
ncbi:hypothetical protein ACS0TY_010286 [Phlomoides rotata]